MRNRIVFDLPERTHIEFSRKVYKGMRSAVLTGLVKAFLEFIEEEGIEKIGYIAEGMVSIRIKQTERKEVTQHEPRRLSESS